MAADGIDAVVAREALERTLSSAAFARNERQSRFLRFLVERHLEGRDNELKESVIALEVFDRRPDYDPKVDAIVRTEAVRLRARLSKYYETEGRLDPIAIEVPKGYRPAFHRRAAAPSQSDAGPLSRRRVWAAVGLGAVSVAVAAVAAAAWWLVPPDRGPVTTGRRPYEANVEAYDLYLRGRQVMAAFPARVRPVASSAVAYYEAAIAKDPDYALAYAGMADAFIAVERNMGSRNSLNAWPRAKEAAARALELDPMLSEAHAAMAAIRAREYAWLDAERGFRRGIELNPNNALAHLELGVRVLVVQGRLDEGLSEVHRALAIDPLSPYINTEAGEALLLAGRYGDAVEQVRKAIALDPSRNRAYSLMARALSLEGKPAEALEVLEKSVKLGAPPVATSARTPGAMGAWVTCVEVRAGRRERSLLLDEVRNSPRPATWLAFAYACLEATEQALASLEMALAANEPGIPELLRAPEVSSLRSQARFAVLRKQVGLQP